MTCEEWEIFLLSVLDVQDAIAGDDTDQIPGHILFFVRGGEEMQIRYYIEDKIPAGLIYSLVHRPRREEMVAVKIVEASRLPWYRRFWKWLVH